MTVRHASRHIEASLRAHVVDVLAATHWTDVSASSRPFQVAVAPKVTSIYDGRDPALAVGEDLIVNVVLLGQDPDEDIEIGGSNVETSYDFAVTVSGKAGVCAALAEDVHDALAGRSRRPIVPFYVAGVEVTDELLELEEVSAGRAKPDRPDWHLVLGTIRRGHQRSW